LPIFDKNLAYVPMRLLFQIFFLFFLFIPCKLFSQDPALESRKIQADSILSCRGEVYITIPANVRKSLLADIPHLTPDRQTDSLIYFYVNSNQFQKIAEAGLNYKILKAPSMLAPVKMASSLDEVLAGKAYPSYQQYLDIMKRFRDNYPGICKIDTIGYSIGGKLILSARLQRGNYAEGDRAIVFYSSTMHGDESVGYSLMLMLINDFLVNASNSPKISRILDEMVILINPLSNPDGAYFQSDTSLFGSKRTNLNNIDLNRSFPDARLGMNYSLSGQQKENLAMIKYMEKFPPNFSANFHTGAEILNYPWDTWEPEDTLVAATRYRFPHPDNNWFIEICKEYVDTARKTDPSYLRLYPEGYVIGSIWYKVYGGRQDFVTYYLRGREITIELSNDKLPAASQISGFWTKNHSALVKKKKKAGFGVFGMVSDSISGDLLSAKVEIPGYDKNESYIYSHKATGKFFRYLPEGNYTLQISAEGYRTRDVSVEVIKNQQTAIDIALKKIQLEVKIKILKESRELIIELKDDDSEVFSVEVLDLTGRKVQEKFFIGTTGTITGPASQGMYILKVKSKFQSVSRLVFL